MFYENKEDCFFAVEELNSLQYPLHIHSYIELVHVMKGSLEMQIGKKKYLIPEGSLAMIFPNVPHSYHTLSAKGKAQLNIINSYLDLLPLHKNLLLSIFPSNPVLAAEDLHPDILFAEKRLFTLTEDEKDRALISSFLSLILCRVFPLLQLAEYQKQPPQDMVCGIVAYIADHFCEDISLSDIAVHFGIGKYALSRIVSNVLKVRFTAYVNALRMNHARYLLLNSNMTITAIALECGYRNQQTFNRVFKEHYSCTPKDYRIKVLF